MGVYRVPAAKGGADLLAAGRRRFRSWREVRPVTRIGPGSGRSQRSRGRAGRLAAALALLAAVGLGTSPAWADAAAPIPLELNKLEPLPAPAAAPAGGGAAAAGCRAYLVVTNPDAAPIEQLRLDVILFGTDGVILRRLALDLSPLAPHKTAVRLFDLQGQPCDGIGRLLVNDVLACQTGQQGSASPDQQRQACLDRLQVSSRAKAELTK